MKTETVYQATILRHNFETKREPIHIFRSVLNPSYLWNFISTKQIESNLRIKNLVKLPQIKTHAFGRHCDFQMPQSFEHFK